MILVQLPRLGKSPQVVEFPTFFSDKISETLNVWCFVDTPSEEFHSFPFDTVLSCQWELSPMFRLFSQHPAKVKKWF